MKCESRGRDFSVENDTAEGEEKALKKRPGGVLGAVPFQDALDRWP